MYIRCVVCQAATWIETLEPGAVQLSVRCQQCEQEYSLLSAGELGTSADEQYQRARQFAEYNAIDLPSAYSVMLGIMTLDEAESARDNRVRETKRVTALDETEPEQELPYDEGFHPAVVEGLLTIPQATNRGDRRALATRLAERHALPMELAFKVADNRLPLAEARELRPPVVPVPVSSRPATTFHKVLLLGFAVVVVAGVGIQGWRTWNTSMALPSPVVNHGEGAATGRPPSVAESFANDPVAAAIASTEVRTDEEGRVLSVAGPDPITVLIAYCASGKMAGRLEPVELARPLPSFPGSRLGIFRDTDRFGALQAIRIKKDRRTRRWVAGDGQRPIAMSDPPEFPPDHPRIPVSLN